MVLTKEAQDTVEWLRVKFGFETTPFEMAQLTLLARIARALEGPGPQKTVYNIHTAGVDATMKQAERREREGEQ